MSVLWGDEFKEELRTLTKQSQIDPSDWKGYTPRDKLIFRKVAGWNWLLQVSSAFAFEMDLPGTNQLVLSSSKTFLSEPFCMMVAPGYLQW